jgi:hypothetical protein
VRELVRLELEQHGDDAIFLALEVLAEQIVVAAQGSQRLVVGASLQRLDDLVTERVQRVVIADQL